MCEEKNRGGRAGGPSTPVEKRGKGRGGKKDTPAQVQRMMKRLGVTFKGVKDPRAQRGKRHPLRAMLMLLVQALAVGKRVLRRAEELGEDMLREGTAPEGLEPRWTGCWAAWSRRASTRRCTRWCTEGWTRG
jgi:hypothetical protein